MADAPITSRAPRAFPVVSVLTHYIAAALTTGTAKWEWVVPYRCRILDVICDSETAGTTGGTSDIIDVNKNGTTIYTTQARRPTLLLANTGMFSETAEPDITTVAPGDIISFDVDQVCTVGSARFKIAILLGNAS